MDKKEISRIIEFLSSKNKTRYIVAEEYGIKTRTLYNRMKFFSLDIPPGTLYPKDLKKIYNALGIPPYYKRRKAEKSELATHP